MPSRQIKELTYGLGLSELPFLWILWKPEGLDDSELLPNGFWLEHLVKALSVLVGLHSYLYWLIHLLEGASSIQDGAPSLNHLNKESALICKGIKWLLQQRRYCQVTENSNRGERRALTTEGSQIAVTITTDQNLHEEYTRKMRVMQPSALRFWNGLQGLENCKLLMNRKLAAEQLKSILITTVEGSA
ncbi:hypothetical protein POTOM_054706 [Populus tomentosa]|uniref:Uncharacterized protein n=1 Tax=Populus tomentosa TaxID=118781 RepID=A0A8X7XZA1_POPTO|nr:hypothetical protein POTOM_054706 [Populus tomentosa]